jgi:hypothetical protein
VNFCLSHIDQKMERTTSVLVPQSDNSNHSKQPPNHTKENKMFRFKASQPFVASLAALVVVSPWTAQATDWPVLDYMYEIKGRGTVAGVHNKYSRTPNSFSQTAQQKSGKVPGLWSGDFLFDAENIANRWTVVNEAKRQYEQGALVNIMWHACNPTLSEPCNYSSHCSGDGPWSDISDNDWQQLVSQCEWKTNRHIDSTTCCWRECLRCRLLTAPGSTTGGNK